MSHHSNIVPFDQTFILAGYTVPCIETVVAWEFCYRRSGGSVTFYPGIWRITGTRGSNTDYALVQSNSITYDASIRTNGTSDDQCQRVNLSVTNQFTAPAGSVVGLYSGTQAQLLYTNTDSSITTYQFGGNKSSITINPSDTDVNYNIAVRIHFGKMQYLYVYLKMYFIMCVHVCTSTFQRHLCTLDAVQLTAHEGVLSSHVLS